MESPALLVIAIAVIGYGLYSRVFARWSLTAPMIFTALGLVMSSAVSGLLGFEITAHQIKLLAEITLILVLFSDAAGVDIRLLRADESIPARMLILGLPLAMVLGTITARLLLPELSLIQCALLAVVLAPTDAALSRSVIVNETVPLRIRQTINAESGLNDGLALPAVFILIALASPGDQSPEGIAWAGFIAQQVVLGTAAGMIFGWLVGKALERSDRKNAISPEFERISAVALAIGAYVAALMMGGNGFIAAFTAGGALGVVARRARGEMQRFGETEGQLLALLTFLAFGAVMLPDALQNWSWNGAGFALASLFIIRPVAIAVSLTGSGLTWPTRLFLGWFGPRGLASIVFVLLIDLQLGHAFAAPLIAIASLTIGTSIILHGLSAGPLGQAYARWLSQRGDRAALKEFTKAEAGSDLRRSRH